jgi:hypothetical protein
MPSMDVQPSSMFIERKEQMLSLIALQFASYSFAATHVFRP